jgi:hypothetical protein
VKTPPGVACSTEASTPSEEVQLREHPAAISSKRVATSRSCLRFFATSAKMQTEASKILPGHNQSGIMTAPTQVGVSGMGDTEIGAALS